MAKRGITVAVDLSRTADGKPVSVAGVVLLRQMPGNAKGVVFLTLEDETGSMNLIVWPDVWRANHRTARAAPALISHGELQRQRGVVHVIVDRLERLQPLQNELVADQVKGDCAPRRPRRSEVADPVDVQSLPDIDLMHAAKSRDFR